MKDQVTASFSPLRRSRAAQAAFQLLGRRRGGPGDAIGARQGDAGDLVEPVDADDFLDDIGRAVDVVAAQAGR